MNKIKPVFFFLKIFSSSFIMEQNETMTDLNHVTGSRVCYFKYNLFTQIDNDVICSKLIHSGTGIC